MKYISIFLLGILCSEARAQEGNWDTYMAKFAGKPGSVLVDMDLAHTAPDHKYPNLVITGPKAHKCDPNGLPDKEEIDELEDILNATGNFLTGITPKVLAGTLMYKCERLNYYYVKDTVGIRNALARMYSRSYKGYDYVVNIKSDRDWVTYRTFLYPDEDSRNWMENDKVITKMLATGDDLTKPRDINFDFFFRSDTDRNFCAAFATQKGYKTTKATDSLAGNAPFELTISKYGYVKTDTICTMSAELKKEAKLRHGFYNLWDAPLKR